MIKVQKWNELLALDELNRELAAGRVLNTFTALQPAFFPTFKRSRDMFLPSTLNKATMVGVADLRDTVRLFHPLFNDH
jgi:hypothetical protein